MRGIVTNSSERTLKINVETLAYGDAFLRKIMLHEVGHIVGFADMQPAYYPQCDSQSSIMWGVASPSSPGATSITTNDDCSTSGAYYVRDESPIIIPLADAGIRLTGPEVFFDLSGRGPEVVGWTEAGSGSGFLVLDRDGDGVITGGRELFGNFTPLSWDMTGVLANNGFAALAWFDQPEQGGNGDGVIDAGDQVFSKLALWVDSNHNGVSEPGEGHRLEDVGIVRISLDVRESRRRDRYGNEFRFRAPVTFDRDGVSGVRFAYDVFLTRGW